MSTPSVTRLPAAERRRAILGAALRVFSTGSYAGATTAEIAREAGISEPLLYRHFASKRELYFACLEEAWARLLAAVDRGGRRTLGDAWGGVPRELKTLLPNLWVQAITEAGEDEEIRRFVRAHMRKVHDEFADAIRDAQAAGIVAGDRDPNAEAWIFVGGTRLLAVAAPPRRRASEGDFEAIRRERHRWLGA
jgi:AcrR family transcriptional regulator